MRDAAAHYGGHIVAIPRDTLPVLTQAGQQRAAVAGRRCLDAGHRDARRSRTRRRRSSRSARRLPGRVGQREGDGGRRADRRLRRQRLPARRRLPRRPRGALHARADDRGRTDRHAGRPACAASPGSSPRALRGAGVALASLRHRRSAASRRRKRSSRSGSTSASPRRICWTSCSRNPSAKTARVASSACLAVLARRRLRASCSLSCRPRAVAGRRAGAGVVAGRQAHRRVVSRSHLDDDAGRQAGEGVARLTSSDGRARSSASRPGRPTATASPIAADRGDGFDIFVVALKNGVAAGAPVAVTTMPGDERWPSWTADGRLVFAHRDARPSGRNGDPEPAVGPVPRRRRSPGSEAWQAPLALTETDRQRNLSARVARRHQGRVRVGARLRRRSRSVVDAGAAGGDRQADAARRASAEAGVVVGAVSVGTDGKPLRANRITRVRGNEAYPSWAPDNTRLAFYAVREGIGSVWVATVGAAASRRRPKIRMPRAEAGRAAATGVAHGRRAGVVAGRQDAARVGPARSAAGLQRQPAAQRRRGAAAVRAERRVPVVARRRAAAGARRRRRRGRRDRAVAGAVRRDVRSRVDHAAVAVLLVGVDGASSGRARATSSGRARRRRRPKPISRR